MTDEDLHKIWSQPTGDERPLFMSKIEKSYAEVESKIQIIENAGKLRKRRKRLRSILLMTAAVAASVAIVALSSIAIYQSFLTKPRGEQIFAAAEPMEFIECSTVAGEIKTVLLPDSSKATLNSESILIYPKAFSESKRSVFLNGEAVFDVTHDDARQFVVSTGSFKILVHGTKFNVMAYSDDDVVSTVLCRGSISVLNSRDEKEYYLVPNMSFSLDRKSGKIKIASVNADDATLWTSGGLCFNNASIMEIINAVERRHKVKIYLGTDKYDQDRITAKFLHGETEREIMDALARLMPGLHYRINSLGEIYIN